MYDVYAELIAAQSAQRNDPQRAPRAERSKRLGRTRTSGITSDADGNKLINKQINGQTIFARLGRVNQEAAEAVLAGRIAESGSSNLDKAMNLLSRLPQNATSRTPKKMGVRAPLGVGSQVPELDTCVFVIPEKRTKNGESRVVVLNDIARRIVDEVRGQHPEYVFVYSHNRGRSGEKGMRRPAHQAKPPRPIETMNSNG